VIIVALPSFAHPYLIASGGNADVSRNRNLQSSPLEPNNADVSRNRNLQSSPLEPNNADVSRGRNLLTAELESNSADLSRNRNMQPSELASPMIFQLTVEVTNLIGLPIEGATVKAANVTLLTNSSGGVIMSLPYGTYDVTASSDPYYLPTLSKVDLYTDKTIALTLSPSPGSEFDISIMPPIITTSIGGTATFTIWIDNYGETSDIFSVNVTGLDTSWYSLEKNPVHLLTGETASVHLTVSVPEVISAVGNYSFNVFVHELLQIGKSASAQLVVALSPIMYGLEPDNDTIISSTEILISWETSSNASSEVYMKRLGDPAYNHTVDQWGNEHFVYIYNLTRNMDYVWYACSRTAYGNVTSYERTLHVSNGISFVQDVYTFEVKRDYAQYASVSVINTDSRSHNLLLNASNPYEDLIVGFVGEGSMDQVVTLSSGETKNVDFCIFAQDAMQQTYTFTIQLTNIDVEKIVDYALVRVDVRWPNLNLTLSEGTSDPWTLSKTLNVTNYGDPITDLRIDSSDELVGKVLFRPTIWHAYLANGESLSFDVVPVLTSNFTSYIGLITAEGAGRIIASLQVNFTLPPGKAVFTVSTPQVRIEFSKYYDADDSPNTNPLPDGPVETYTSNDSQIFAAQIIVDVYQNDEPVSMANLSLTMWNETGTLESVEYSETDFTGKAMFAVFGEGGNYSYQAELVGYNITTEKRNFSTDANSLYKVNPGNISWLDVSDGNSTFDMSQNISTVVLDKTPFVFRGHKDLVDQNMTAKLCLSWNSDPYKRVFIPGTISGNTIIINTSTIPVGSFTAMLMSYSSLDGLSFSEPINVTCLDSSGMYVPGSFSYQLPFPLNATHIIQLTIDHETTPADSNLFLELADIEPSNSSSEYILKYLVMSNETATKELNISVVTEGGQQYNDTYDLQLQPFTPNIINFTIPVWNVDGSLVKFNATASIGTYTVETRVSPRVRYYYDLRIWVGSYLGFLEDIWNGQWSIDPWHTIRTAISCGIGSFPRIEVGVAKAIIEMGNMIEGRSTGGKSTSALVIKGSVGFTADQAQVIYQEPFQAANWGWFNGKGWGGQATGIVGLPIFFDSAINCINDYRRALQSMPEGPVEAFLGTVDFVKFLTWYCTNKPIAYIEFTISNAIGRPSPSQTLSEFQIAEAYNGSNYPSVANVYMITRFTLPRPRNSYRTHDVYLLVNDFEVGQILATIPEGHYVFEVEPNILNYPISGIASNSILLDTIHMNGGHYIVYSDLMVMIVLRQQYVTLIASNQQEAETRVANITKTTLANKPDPAIFPEDIRTEPNPVEGMQTINVTLWDLGAADVRYVQVKIYDGSTTIVDTIAFIPFLSNVTMPVKWNATAGVHTIRVVVNPDNLLDEMDKQNNIAVINITVSAQMLPTPNGGGGGKMPYMD
jgi:uncharacterized membrane protein